jgi:hypothetical protein
MEIRWFGRHGLLALNSQSHLAANTHWVKFPEVCLSAFRLYAVVHLPEETWGKRYDLGSQTYQAAITCSQEASPGGWILGQSQAQYCVAIVILRWWDWLQGGWGLQPLCPSLLEFPAAWASLQDHIRSSPSPWPPLVAISHPDTVAGCPRIPYSCFQDSRAPPSHKIGPLSIHCLATALRNEGSNNVFFHQILALSLRLRLGEVWGLSCS